MKFRRRGPALLVAILLPSLSVTVARSIKNAVLDELPAIPTTLANSIGTADAPVDGKDGKPHAGPFIETSAQRERQKAKDAGEELVPDVLSTTKQTTIPQSNDGVMDDASRKAPKEGTRGTEGGVSEKSKDSRLGEQKIPDAPKEAPPLPHSEEQKMKGKDSKETLPKPDEDKKFLEKPADLPNKPHDIPMPQNPSSPQDEHPGLGKDTSGYKPSTPPSLGLEEGNEIISPLHSLVLSFTMILFSEIGDKTFLVAALMAMRHPRMVVFSAAFSALLVMTVLSAVLGHAVPTLIPKYITNFLASGLFLVFGVKMLLEARKMSPDEGVSEEMKEVEMELEEKEHQQRKMNRRRSSVTPYMLESGRHTRKGRSSTSRLPSPPESPSSSSSREHSPSRSSTVSNLLNGISNLLSLLLSPAWVQTFVMTFLGEWGDRSQIATIAMAAGQDYWWVTAGAVAGHSICTAAAVLGGKAIAGRVSMKTVTLGGAIAFLVFGLIYLFEAIY